MDPLSILLNGARVRDGFVLRSILSPPWSVQVRDQAPLNVVAVLSGNPWVLPGRDEAVRLAEGEIAILRGTHAFTFADDPATPIQVVVQPGPQRTIATSSDLTEVANVGVRTWANDVRGRDDGGHDTTVLLIGKFRGLGDAAMDLINALPPLLVLDSATHVQLALVSLLAEQAVQDEPGQDLVLDRLLDLLLVATLREWLIRPDAPGTAPWCGQLDPAVRSALRHMHSDPAHPWTVDALARRSGVSRATLARRFTELVGKPPMAYLTKRRIDLAAELLVESDATIGAVARQVGYSSAFALSAAFKRTRGVSPQHHRGRA